MNMESTYAIMNLGSIFVILVFIIIQFLLYFVCKTWKANCKRCFKNIEKDLFWVIPVEYVGGSIMEVGFAVLINYQRPLNYSSSACVINNIVLFAYSFVVVAYIIWLFVLLCRKSGDLEDSREKFGTVFD